VDASLLPGNSYVMSGRRVSKVIRGNARQYVLYICFD
jgi:hypothetical protein